MTGKLPDLADDAGRAGPPRSNGELVFEEPWESRAFGLAVALHDAGVVDFEAFRVRLVAEITAWEGTHDAETAPYRYYERWLAALERTLLAHGLVDESGLVDAREAIEHAWEHES